MKILFIGDIVGGPGRRAVLEVLPELARTSGATFIIANGENAAHGRGITAKIAAELFAAGVHGITMGNHTWDNKDLFDWIDDEPRLVRPANYPAGTPGIGHTVLKSGGKELLLVNLMGRTFLPPLDCPFAKMDDLLGQHKKTKHVFVDFHAEATSEKIAMGWHLDGRVSAVVGTHTHVQTNDNAVLPKGTAYVTDVGMCGPRHSVLGMETDSVIQKFRTQLPVRFQVAEGKWVFHAVLVDLNDESGKAEGIRLIRLAEDDYIKV